MTTPLAVLGWGVLVAAAEPEIRDAEAHLVGSQLHFTARLHDAEHVASVEVRYRAADTSMQSAEMARDHNRLLAVVDAGPLLLGGDSVRVMYSLVARDPSGEVVARVASDDQPVSIIVTRVFATSELDRPDDPLVSAPVPEDAKENGLSRAWWIWTVGAVAVLGAGIAAGVVLTR